MIVFASHVILPYVDSCVINHHLWSLGSLETLLWSVVLRTEGIELSVRVGGIIWITTFTRRFTFVFWRLSRNVTNVTLKVNTYSIFKRSGSASCAVRRKRLKRKCKRLKSDDSNWQDQSTISICWSLMCLVDLRVYYVTSFSSIYLCSIRNALSWT